MNSRDLGVVPRQNSPLERLSDGYISAYSLRLRCLFRDLHTGLKQNHVHMRACSHACAHTFAHAWLSYLRPRLCSCMHSCLRRHFILALRISFLHQISSSWCISQAFYAQLRYRTATAEFFAPVCDHFRLFWSAFGRSHPLSSIFACFYFPSAFDGLKIK